MTNKTPETPEMPGMQIYGALLRVAEAVAPIIKVEKRELGYSIAGAEQVMAAVRPHLIENKVLVFPIRSEIVKMTEVTTKSGRIMNRTIVKMDFRFLHTPSGTYLDIPVEGEGQDMGDKSINKARTICQKYALRQTLMLEFGDADPDNDPSEQQERAATQSKKQEEVTETGEMAGDEAWGYWLELVKEADKLGILHPDHVFPLPLSVLKKSYKDLNTKVKAKSPPKEGE